MSEAVHMGAGMAAQRDHVADPADVRRLARDGTDLLAEAVGQRVAVRRRGSIAGLPGPQHMAELDHSRRGGRRDEPCRAGPAEGCRIAHEVCPFCAARPIVVAAWPSGPAFWPAKYAWRTSSGRFSRSLASPSRTTLPTLST